MWTQPLRYPALLFVLLPLACSAPDPVDPDACMAPQVYAEPGCGTSATGAAALPSAGCFTPCDQAGATCASGGTCKNVWVNPCVCPPGAICCQACGGEKLLCLP